MILVIFGVVVTAQALLIVSDFGESLDITWGYTAVLVLAFFVTGSNSMGLCYPCIAFTKCITGRLYIDSRRVYRQLNRDGNLLRTSQGIHDGIISTRNVNRSLGDLVVGQIIVGDFVVK